MSFFVIFLGIVNQSLILLYQGFFSMPFLLFKAKQKTEYEADGSWSRFISSECSICDESR